MRQPAARVQRTCWGAGAGGLRGVSHPFGPASVRGGGGSKRYAALFVGPRKGNQPMACTLALWWLKFGPTESAGGGGG